MVRAKPPSKSKSKSKSNIFYVCFFFGEIYEYTDMYFCSDWTSVMPGLYTDIPDLPSPLNTITANFCADDAGQALIREYGPVTSLKVYFPKPTALTKIDKRKNNGFH